jgi:hypothetical protein
MDSLSLTEGAGPAGSGPPAHARRSTNPERVGHTSWVLSDDDLGEAAALLGRLLRVVETGGLAADGPAGVALVRQMQGAAGAFALMAAGVERADSGGLPSASPEPAEAD